MMETRQDVVDRTVTELREYADYLESELRRVRRILSASQRWNRAHSKRDQP